MFLCEKPTETVNSTGGCMNKLHLLLSETTKLFIFLCKVTHEPRISSVLSRRAFSFFEHNARITINHLARLSNDLSYPKS